uniref:Uncharacterized protein n=1 Tax=Timema bartmani TaxID=61472 RepID=A0A7R9FBL2_9NEOP|nr:unnamed protein product [Timema bartmani]
MAAVVQAIAEVLRQLVENKINRLRKKKRIWKVSSAGELAVDDKATSKKSLIDFQSLPTRSYLQQTVIPILEEGLTSLTQDRPSDPIGYLATYLLENKGQYDLGTETLDSGSQVEDVHTQAKDSKLLELT